MENLVIKVNKCGRVVGIIINGEDISENVLSIKMEQTALCRPEVTLKLSFENVRYEYAD